MNTNNSTIAHQPNQRLLSLDFMRGLIMVLLMMEGASLYEHLHEATSGAFMDGVLNQFSHHPWHGLRFWDLIQPGFMFVAGTALALSLHRQQLSGMPWRSSFVKVLKRSGWLFFFGVLNYAVKKDGLTFELWNVLTQLSFTTLVAFLIFNWSNTAQIIFSVLLLLLAEVLYRYTHISGYDQPFIDQHNFGNYMDTVLMGKVDDDGWVAINCISTSCHTIWGALAGKLLFSIASNQNKIKQLVVMGIIALLLGYMLDWFSITPIIKRIATSSFVFASGGWCLLALAFLYWWIDIKGHQRYLTFFTVIGTNSLFIYLFMGIVASHWFNGYIDAITFGLLKTVLPVTLVAVISSLLIFLLEWLLCLYLYRKKIFIKI
jgi:predicted acyltransferase